MKKTVGMLLVVAFATASASAGVVTFTPVGPTTVTPGTPVEFDVTATVETLDDFDAIVMVIGATEATPGNFLSVESWVYNAAFTAECPYGGTYVFEWPGTVYDSNLGNIGGFLQPSDVGEPGPEDDIYWTSWLVGTVTVGTTGLAYDTYTVMVDTDTEGTPQQVTGLYRGLLSEGLLGSAEVTVIPEPAAIALLGLGALGFLRRRRA